MQTNSSNSRVHRWPAPAEVIAALRVAAQELLRRRPDVVRIGYFGSLAAGGYGFGSDADVVIVVSRTERPFTHRLLDYDLSPLPVPADILVYTAEELDAIVQRNDRYGEEMRRVVWL